MANPTISIDVVSDVMCPWCFIGKRRLEKTQAMLDSVGLDIRWRPFQLDPTLPADGIERRIYLERKFGSRANSDQIYASVTAAGLEEGIPFRFDAIEKASNTLDAHRLIRWAASGGAQDRMAERLFELYFLEGADIGDRNVLLGAAGAVGMRTELVAGLLAGDEDKDAVKQEIALARHMGITGVPTFIVDNRYAIVGAQSADTIAETVLTALKASDDTAPADPAGGPAAV